MCSREPSLFQCILAIIVVLIVLLAAGAANHHRLPEIKPACDDNSCRLMPLPTGNGSYTFIPIPKK